MKCPKCGTDSTKKDRAAGGGRCLQCHRTWVFDPPSPLSDLQVSEALAKLSKQGTLRYTREQAVCEIERTLAKREHGLARVAAIARANATPAKIALAASPFAALFFAFGFSPWAAILPGLVGVGALITLLRAPSRERAVAEAEAKMLPRALDANAESITRIFLDADPQELCVARRLERATASRKEFDLSSYGFDRVVVVEHDDLVDMLVANQFHFQHNAAILSFSDYPRQIADLVHEQLRRSPEAATVYVLHDASSEGYERGDRWLADAQANPQRVVRVGLSPRQVERLGPKHAATKPPRPDAPEALRTFLAQHRVSLHALRPEQMMILLFNAMTATDRVDAVIDPGGVVFVGDWSEVADAPYDFG